MCSIISECLIVKIAGTNPEVPSCAEVPGREAVGTWEPFKHCLMIRQWQCITFGYDFICLHSILYNIIYVLNIFVFLLCYFSHFCPREMATSQVRLSAYPFPVHQVYLYLECISALFMIARTNKRVNCWFQFDMLFFYANSKSSNHFRT